MLESIHLINRNSLNTVDLRILFSAQTDILRLNVQYEVKLYAR